MKILRLILFPFIPFYAAAICLRNFLFDKKFFKEKKVNAKVISVGNISVGGSGKTPLVIYLCEMIKKDGHKIGVLSRGYRRKTTGYLLVSDGDNILTKVENSGDEIFQTAKDCKIPAAVAENRFEGAQKFIKDTNINTLILDDAFQHRWIKREINLLIFEQGFLLNSSLLNQALLPAGNMREPISAAKRADAIILNRKFSEMKEIPAEILNHFEGKKIFTAFYKATEFTDVVNKTSYSLGEFSGQKSLIVSGVANPGSFINALKQFNIDVTNRIIFVDHKSYSFKEIQEIRRKFYSTNSNSVVTTEKDAVKLSSFSKELDDIDIFYLKIEMKMDHEESFINFIKNKLN
jgi:tetraacyldisaccharide 4'-kinase